MPNYPFAANSSTVCPPCPSLYPGDQINLFNAEQPSVPQRSISIALPKLPLGLASASVTIQISFSGAPGSYEIDIQEADIDADIYYQNAASGNITTAPGSNNTVRADLSVNAKFLTALLKTRTNAVNVTVLLSR